MTYEKEGYAMAQRNRYQDLTRLMTAALIGSAVLFILYLLFAGLGIVWAKVLTAIFAILLPVLCLGFLYLCHEFKRRRSHWMILGFAAIAFCTLVSLITNMPSPAK
jgi:hypothetical protein